MDVVFVVGRVILAFMFIAGGVKTGTFRNPTVSGEIRGHIEAMLGLRPNRP